MKRFFILSFFMIAAIILLGSAIALQAEEGEATPEQATPTEASPRPQWPNPDTVTSVSELPEVYQYSDEDLAEIQRVYKAVQAIPVDVANSEVVTCQDCYLLFNGILLTSPFYFQIVEDQVYVNGYLFFPVSIEMQRLTTPSFIRNRPSRSENGILGYDDDCLKEIIATKKTIINTFKEIAAKNEDPETIKSLLQIKCRELGIDIYNVVASPVTLYAMFDLPCHKKNGAIVLAPERYLGPSDNLPEIPLSIIKKDQLKHQLRDHVTLIPSVTRASFSFLSTNNTILSDICNDIKKNRDDQIEIYSLSKLVDGINIALSIYANRDAFIESYRREFPE